MTVAFISPHLDDAVLSCARVIEPIPFVTVVTVLAGYPAARDLLTPHDEACGFLSSVEAVATRRAEDIRACQYLGATWQHLDLFDTQYQRQTEAQALAALLAVIDRALPPIVALVAPLGLSHVDHHTVSDAAIAAGEARQIPVRLYEDLPYRVTAPELVPTRLADLRSSGHALSLVDHVFGRDQLYSKATAVGCYASQAAVIDGALCVHAPERYWSIL